MRWLVLTVAVVATGCGRGPAVPLAPVGGVVTIAGRPVGGGQIMFAPTSAGPTATGVIGPDGRYSLTTFKRGDGAMLGAHDVMIESMPDVSTTLPEDILVTKKAAPPPEIPQKYNLPGRSGLSATVTSGSNTIDFALE